jgi:hypothetical protein
MCVALSNKKLGRNIYLVAGTCDIRESNSFCLPLATVPAGKALQQRRQRTRQTAYQGERGCKIASSLSSNASAAGRQGRPCTGEGGAGGGQGEEGCARRRRPGRRREGTSAQGGTAELRRSWAPPPPQIEVPSTVMHQPRPSRPSNRPPQMGGWGGRGAQASSSPLPTSTRIGRERRKMPLEIRRVAGRRPPRAAAGHAVFLDLFAAHHLLCGRSRICDTLKFHH